MALPSKPFPAPGDTTVENIRGLAGPVIALGVVIALLYFGRVFFITSLVAVIIAFILEPFVEFLMRARLPRSVASFLVCAAALMGVYLAGVGAYSQAARLFNELPQYGQRIGEVVDSVRERVEGAERRLSQVVMPGSVRRRELERQQAQQKAAAEKAAAAKRKRRAPEPVPLPPSDTIQEVRIHDERSPVTEYVYSQLGTFYRTLLMASFIPFLVYFMLSWRDHINRSFLQFFSGEDRLVAARSLQGIAGMARAFVVGNFLLGVLLAIFSSLSFWAMRLPYPLLVGPLSGFLSLVPYVGLPLAAIPPMFVALTVYKTFSAYLLVFGIVALFHLLAMNLLYPKIVGSRVHLNPLVVTFSLMLWGFMWDAAGLLLAIPLTAGIKAVCDNVKSLRPIGKFLGD